MSTEESRKSKAELRTKKIQEIIDRRLNPDAGSKRITYNDVTKEMPAFKIPLDCLVFNSLNARIGTFVKTHETQTGLILDASREEDENLIFSFLWEAHKKNNINTLESIGTRGQDIPGIITKDGVIIDGNRRCMAIKKLQNQREKYPEAPKHFNAVILPDSLDDDPKAIRELETRYQMGVDEKVDYNAIEKYLKCKEMVEVDGYTPQEISTMIADTEESDVKKYLSTLELMEDYLNTIGYKGHYRLLDQQKVEGPFVDLRANLEKHQTGSRLQGREWKPKKADIAELKNITFHYIRAGFRAAHDIRDIGNPSKGQGFFSHRKLWPDFVMRHYDNIESINDNEKSLDDWRAERPEEKIEKIIEAREADWKKQVGTPNSKPSLLKENISKTSRDLADENESNAPMVLLQRALATLNAINKDSDSVEGEDIKNISHEIRKLVEGFIKTVDRKAKTK